MVRLPVICIDANLGVLNAGSRIQAPARAFFCSTISGSSVDDRKHRIG
jgi:hypothetical protein